MTRHLPIYFLLIIVISPFLLSQQLSQMNDVEKEGYVDSGKILVSLERAWL